MPKGLRPHPRCDVDPGDAAGTCSSPQGEGSQQRGCAEENGAPSSLALGFRPHQNFLKLGVYVAAWVTKPSLPSRNRDALTVVLAVQDLEKWEIFILRAIDLPLPSPPPPHWREYIPAYSGCGTLSDLLSEAVGPDVNCKTCPRSWGNAWWMCFELHRATATLSQRCLNHALKPYFQLASLCLSFMSPRLKAWLILKMPARATERFGNELQDYKMQILGFWCTHSVVSSVSAGSHRTGGLVAQGPLHCLTSQISG